MQAIDQSEVGIESECEIVIEMHSDGVPSIDMIDLPGSSEFGHRFEYLCTDDCPSGLTQLKPRGGPDLPSLTQKLVEKYIADGRTGAVICVINATLPEVQNAPIFRILSGLPEELKSNCIGVFAKTDMTQSNTGGCAKVQASLGTCIAYVICIVLRRSHVFCSELVAASHRSL
jgi:hypothetical protein